MVKTTQKVGSSCQKVLCTFRHRAMHGLRNALVRADFMIPREMAATYLTAV